MTQTICTFDDFSSVLIVAFRESRDPAADAGRAAIAASPIPTRWPRRRPQYGSSSSKIYDQEAKRQQEINDGLIKQSGNENQYVLHEEMGKVMTDNVTVVRFMLVPMSMFLRSWRLRRRAAPLGGLRTVRCSASARLRAGYPGPQ